jgi:hypothetical protein
MTKPNATKRRLLLLAICSSMTGCAVTPVPTDEDKDVQQLLTEISGDYPAAKSCLSSLQIRDIKVLDERHLVFVAARDKVWLNRFRQRCPGLGRMVPVRIKRKGMSPCEGDEVIVDSGVFAMQCYLGDFVEITAEQAAVLFSRDAVRRAK